MSTTQDAGPGPWRDDDPALELPLALTAEQNAVVTARWHRARAAMPALDAVVEGVVARLAEPCGARQEGRKFRLKGLAAFRRQAAARVRLRVDAGTFAEKITDLNRYTVVLATDHYTAGVQQAYALLHEQGFEPVPGSERNSWQDLVHKAFRVAWRDRSGGGTVFEVVFHTPESFAVQSENGPLYDLYRSARIRRPAGGVAVGKSHEDAARLLQSRRYGSGHDAEENQG
ncbi:hypothetical protein GCM10010218_26850 [Streptomyces mashuensis]|uniref:Uncharacterized protein n=1 Tax=Streptomyces mashuensis TaxID=33904 RepID=A0A919B276_9ACTN|nr:hypothetical protein [Streptomyces mashuensis]GHF44164.1 hypothetical protein GCM10010218_26850 [Streptomyces mashuensis]